MRTGLYKLAGHYEENLYAIYGSGENGVSHKNRCILLAHFTRIKANCYVFDRNKRRVTNLAISCYWQPDDRKT